MILGFSDEGTEDFWNGIETSKARKAVPTTIRAVAEKKLDMLDAATSIQDLRIPPSNHLEELKGRLRGYHSIRVSQRYRIIFRWTAAGPDEVRMSDHYK